MSKWKFSISRSSIDNDNFGKINQKFINLVVNTSTNENKNDTLFKDILSSSDENCLDIKRDNNFESTLNRVKSLILLKKHEIIEKLIQSDYNYRPPSEYKRKWISKKVSINCNLYDRCMNLFASFKPDGIIKNFIEKHSGTTIKLINFQDKISQKANFSDIEDNYIIFKISGIDFKNVQFGVKLLQKFFNHYQDSKTSIITKIKQKKILVSNKCIKCYICGSKEHQYTSCFKINLKNDLIKCKDQKKSALLIQNSLSGYLNNPVNKKKYTIFLDNIYNIKYKTILNQYNINNFIFMKKSIIIFSHSKILKNNSFKIKLESFGKIHTVRKINLHKGKKLEGIYIIKYENCKSAVRTKKYLFGRYYYGFRLIVKIL